jgi:hypothetical protein
VSGAVRDWLPLSALEDERIGDTVDLAVRRWSERWFAQSRSSVRRPVVRSPESGASTNDGSWLGFEELIAFSGSETLVPAIATLVLDLPRARQQFTAMDAKLVNLFGVKILRDLADLLASALELGVGHCGWGPVDDPSARDGGLQFSIGDDTAGPAFTISIASSSLVAMRKAMIGSPVAKQAAQVPFSAALAEETLAFSAPLGVSRMKLSEARSLQLGDVVALDTKLDAPISMIAPTSGRTIGEARVEQQSGRAVLVMLAA